MLSFSLTSPAITPVTTSRQSQHSNVITSPASFSSGNQIYHSASVQDEPYLQQWHNGGTERVTSHLYDTITEADVEVSESAIRKRMNAQGISASHPCKLPTKLNQSQSEFVQARLGLESDVSIEADLGVSKVAIRKRKCAQRIDAYKPCKSFKKLTQNQLDSIQARLGKEPDASIAADFKMSITTIRKHRCAQGIAAHSPHRSYSKLTKSQSRRIQARLGKEPDASIAADFGVSENAIQSRRSAQGIPAFQPHRSNNKLTLSQSERVQARLGKEPDTSIAADFEMSRASIQKRRIKQGIAAYKSRNISKPLTQSQSDSIQTRLGKESDSSIAADFGVSKSMIQNRRKAQGIPAFYPRKSSVKLTQSQLDNIQARLGKETDLSIAADFGVSRTVILRRRRTQGIAAYESYKLLKELTQSQLDSIQARLGKEPDANIAADFGVSRAVIRRYRSEQGIAAYEPRDPRGDLTRSPSGSIQARLRKETDATTEADVEESVNTIWRRWFEQGSTTYEPHASRQLHQLLDILSRPETGK